MIRRLAFVVLVACGSASSKPPVTGSSGGGAGVVETNDFRVAVPAGYKDLTASYQAQDPTILASFAGKDAHGGDTVIVLQRAPLPDWIVDRCQERATMTVNSAPAEEKATLDGFAVVDWSGGKACEYSFTSPYGGPRTITERLDPSKPDGDGWMLLCQHNNDVGAIAVCRATRANLQLKKRP